MVQIDANGGLCVPTQVNPTTQNKFRIMLIGLGRQPKQSNAIISPPFFWGGGGGKNTGISDVVTSVHAVLRN